MCECVLSLRCVGFINSGYLPPFCMNGAWDYPINRSAGSLIGIIILPLLHTLHCTLHHVYETVNTKQTTLFSLPTTQGTLQEQPAHY